MLHCLIKKEIINYKNEKNMKTIGWGKPGIYIRKVADKLFKKVADAVEGTAQLTFSDGDKMEARVEGGQVEAVKYKAGSYEFEYGIREAAETVQLIDHVDGVVEDAYVVAVIPENPAAPGIFIECSEVTVSTNYTAEDGMTTTYKHAAMKAANGSAVKRGIITATQSGEGYSLSAAAGHDFTEQTSLDGATSVD